LIAADLSRAEATKHVLKTQLEALKRQVTSIRLRDKQAREMVKTLKNRRLGVEWTWFERGVFRD
jgi:prefoldin subunit 5